MPELGEPPLHQESGVDALILLNDMTSFPREGQRLVHIGASMPVRQRVGWQSSR